MMVAAHPRSLLRLLSVGLGLAMVLTVLGAAPAQAAHVQPARVEGATRYHTAANIATLTFDQADVAHLVTGEDFPDALAASFGAGVAGGPILLTTAETVPQPTFDALEQLQVGTVVVFGGTAAVSPAVEEQLASAGYAVERISGINRYQTASAVAMHYGSGGRVGTLDGQRAALLATGAGFADALAAGPIAAREHFPLFLTPPDTTEVSVNRSLQQLGIDVIVLLGGEEAISSSVERFYEEQGYTVERLAGATRTQTARLLADMARSRLGWDMGLQLLARGDDYPDALAGSAHAAAHTAPILLTPSPTTLGGEAAGWLQQRCPNVTAVRALGGNEAIAQATLAGAVDMANTCAHESGIELTQTCTFSAAGFQIAVPYPEGWHTNSTEPTPDGQSVPPCRVFHHEPFDLPRANELTAYGLLLSVERTSLDDIIDADSPMDEVLSERMTTVAGRRAHVAELRALEDGLSGPAGSRLYRYAVDLGGTRTLIARTHEVADLRYAFNKRVLDVVMGALTLTSDESLSPVGEPRTAAYTSPDFPSQTADVRYLTDVRAAAHNGFNRVVFEFAGAEEPPPFALQFVSPPILADPSGLPVDVAGEAFLEFTATSASGVDRTGDQPRITYDGPERVAVADGAVVQEVVQTGDFENVMTWVLGLDQLNPYSFTVLEDPVRIVVDVHAAS